MISEIIIENFRNHPDRKLDDISSLFAITGQNGSGKSNILRALNLFFNGEIEPGELIDINRDFYGNVSKQKKIIRISCKFELPDEFRFQKTIEESAKDIGLTNKPFWLSRIWEFDSTKTSAIDRFEYRTDDNVEWRKILNEERSIVHTFLTRLIHFRYIPNHLHPVEIIKQESGPLQNALLAKIRRMRNPDHKVNLEGQLEPMAAVGQKLVKPIVDEVTKASGLKGMNITLPTDWTQVALSLDMNLQADEDQPRNVNLHGSGHQSLLALSLLHLLDTQFFVNFGWHQASIWGLEEPESFLHQELCLQVGSMLNRFVQSPRFQILVTTHSPWVMTSCSNGCVVTSASVEVYPPEKLIEQAARAGASAFLHPLLLGATKPLLLVEGPTDRMYIIDAYKKYGRINPWDVHEVEHFSKRKGASGLDEIISNHILVFRGRPLVSPVVLLYDHTEKREGDIKKKDEELKNHHETSAVIQWSSDESNTDLNSQDFAGIEAFLSTDFLKKASKDLPFTLYYPNDETGISVGKRKYKNVKMYMAKYAEKHATKEDYELLMKQLEDMEKRVDLR